MAPKKKVANTSRKSTKKVHQVTNLNGFPKDKQYMLDSYFEKLKAEKENAKRGGPINRSNVTVTGSKNSGTQAKTNKPTSIRKSSRSKATKVIEKKTNTSKSKTKKAAPESRGPPSPTDSHKVIKTRNPRGQIDVFNEQDSKDLGNLVKDLTEQHAARLMGEQIATHALRLAKARMERAKDPEQFEKKLNAHHNNDLKRSTVAEEDQQVYESNKNCMGVCIGDRLTNLVAQVAVEHMIPDFVRLFSNPECCPYEICNVLKDFDFDTVFPSKPANESIKNVPVRKDRKHLS